MLTPELQEQTKPFFTQERVWDILEAIANTHAPGQTVSYTRASVIHQLLEKEGAASTTLVPDYERTGNTLLWLGESFPRRWVFAHADEISYLVSPQGRGTDWPLVPFCKHLSQIEMEAVALRYSPADTSLKISAQGTILPPAGLEETAPRFRVLSGEVQSGDRVVYHYPIRRSGDRVFGSIDNAAGVTACLLAALALSHTCPGLPVGFAFTDEEEGPASHNTSFSRGARRLLHRIGAPDLCLVVDGHHNPPEGGFGMGALFAGFSSQAASTVTPPTLFSAFTNLVAELRSNGIQIHENTGSVSRGDDTAIIEFTPHILLLGYHSDNRHFDQAPPQASLSDLVELAKTVYWTLCKLNP